MQDILIEHRTNEIAAYGTNTIAELARVIASDIA